MREGIVRCSWLFLVLVLAAGIVLADDFHSRSLAEVTKGAQEGNAEFQLELALRFDYGVGMRRNQKQAEKWYRAAGVQGNAQAQNSLGSLLQARRKFSEAREWYERAAAQGLPQGINNLAYLHDLGLGVPQDREKAFHLYEQAADFGWAEAMWNLANMHALGQSVPKSNFDACVWTYRARRYAQPDQADLLRRVGAGIDQLPSMISAEELQRCQESAAAWQPSRARAPDEK